MTAGQLLQQVAYLLKAAVWADSPGDVVFNSRSVFLSSGFLEAQLGDIAYPFAVVSPGSSTHDEENPLLATQQVVVMVWARHEGDRFGDMALVGGQRTSTTGSSYNRGLLEVEERVLNAIAALGPSSACSLSLVAISDAVPEAAEGSGLVVKRAYTFEALIDSQRTYEPAYNFAVAGTTGTLTLTWSDPPAGWNRIGVMVRVIAGSSAPTTTTGTLVGNVAAGVQTTTHAPGAGTWTYAVWGTYNESGGSAVERYSAKAVSKTVVVT